MFIISMKLVLSSPREDVGPATWRPAGVFVLWPKEGGVVWTVHRFSVFSRIFRIHFCNQKNKTKTKNTRESKNKN